MCPPEGGEGTKLGRKGESRGTVLEGKKRIGEKHEDIKIALTGLPAMVSPILDMGCLESHPNF